MTTPVDIKVGIQSEEALRKVAPVLNDIAKTVSTLDGSFGRYERNLKSLLKQLESITRQGAAPGQTIKDLQMVAGGKTVAGRVRQATARGQISDLRQLEEVLAADIVNSQRQLMRNVTKAVQSALVRDFARQRQTMGSLDINQLQAQIEAQMARVSMATQMHGSRGLNRGKIAQSASALGMDNLGTLKAEQAALDRLLAQEQRITEEQKAQNREARSFLSLQERINRATNDQYQALQNQMKAANLNQSMARTQGVLTAAQTAGDSKGAANANAKLQAMRLEQMVLQGAKETSKEYQEQIVLIRKAAEAKERLRQEQLKINAEVREQNSLERSRKFAAGDPAMQETVLNNMIGSRKAAGSMEGRASLLGLQGNLLLNYSLLGGATTALGAMTRGVIELDAEMRQLQAIAGATNAEYAKMKDTIIQASTETKFSALELAEGATILAQVGLSASQIGDVLPKVADFAMAVGTDMKTAIDIVTTTLTVFNQATGETERITNVLTEALNRSKLSMDQLVLGFQYAANITADAGGTFEELTAVLAGMSQAGIRSGSMLGTGLRQIMISLADPTDEVKQLLTDLGLTMDDVDVRTQGLVGVLENFREAGITASQAMGAFETRTAAALVAATNQVDFMKSIQEQMAMTTAAEQAAEVQKLSLKNTFLELANGVMSFINGAAAPYLVLLTQLGRAAIDFGAVLKPLAPLINLVGTALLGMGAVAVITNITRLIATFFGLSGVATTVATQFGVVRTAMAGMTVATTLQAGANGRLSASLLVLRGAMNVIAAHPLMFAILALTTVVGGAMMAVDALSGSTKKYAEEMDEIKTRYDQSQAQMTEYTEVLSQIDNTLERLRSRSETLKNDKAALRVEVMQAASQFNQYGANIRSTTLDMEGLISSTQRARQAVLDLMYAQALQTKNEADAAAAKAGSQLSAQTAIAGKRDGLVSRVLNVNSTISARDFNSMVDASNKTASEKAQLKRDFTLANSTARTSEGAFRVSQSAASVAAFLEEPTTGYGRRPARAAERYREIQGLGTQLATSLSQAAVAQTSIERTQVARTPRFQELQGKTNPSLSGGDFSRGMSDIDRWLRAGRKPDGTPYTARQATTDREALLARAGESVRAAEQGQEAFREYGRGLNSAGGASAVEDAINSNTALGQLQQAMRTNVRERATSQTAALENIEKGLRGNLSMDQIRTVANEVGIDLSGNRVQALSQVRRLKAEMSSGAYEERSMTGSVSAGTQLAFDLANLGEQGGSGPRSTGGGSGSNDAEKNARDAKRITDALASSYKRLSDLAGKSGELKLKDINEFTSEEQLSSILIDVAGLFKTSEEQLTMHYQEKLRGMVKYRGDMQAAGALTSEELADLNAEIANTQQEAEEAVANNLESLQDKMEKALEKVPEIGRPLGHLIDALDKMLKDIAAELTDALREFNQLEANRAMSQPLLDALVRQGRGSSAYAASIQNGYGRLQDRMLPDTYQARLDSANQTRDAINGLLGAPIGTSNGRSIDANNIQAELTAQRAHLATLTMGTQEYTRQSLLVKDLEDSFNRVSSLREQLVGTEQEIEAILNAQADAADVQSAPFGQKLNSVVSDWAAQNGYNQSPLDGLLDGVPQALTTSQQAFSTFFSDVLSGTASVGDAFRTLATTILQAMLDVIASEIAKSFVKMVFQLARSFGGGPSAGPADDLAGLYKEGGFVRAATGKAVRGRDSVPILAMPGEFVLRKSAVDAIGADNLQALNANGNRAISGDNAVQPVAVPVPSESGQPLSIYVVSPDQVPPPSKNEILVMVQDDMINRGPVYKAVKAINQGAI